MTLPRISLLSRPYVPDGYHHYTGPDGDCQPCAALDKMEIDGLVGTLAGDDTAFLAMRDNEHAKKLFHELEILF